MPPHCHLPQGGPAGPGPLQATAQSIAVDIRHLHVPRPTAPVTMVHSSLKRPLRLEARGARTQQANQPRPNTYVIKVTGLAGSPIGLVPPRPQWKPRFTLVPPHRHLPQGGPAGPGPLQATAQPITFDTWCHVPAVGPTAPVTSVHSFLQVQSTNPQSHAHSQHYWCSPGQRHSWVAWTC